MPESNKCPHCEDNVMECTAHKYKGMKFCSVNCVRDYLEVKRLREEGRDALAEEVLSLGGKDAQKEQAWEEALGEKEMREFLDTEQTDAPELLQATA